MPESKSEQVRHSNEEITNFALFGDARGQKWLATAILTTRSERSGDCRAVRRLPGGRASQLSCPAPGGQASWSTSPRARVVKGC